MIRGLTLTGVNAGYGACTGRAALAIEGEVTLRECVVTDNVSQSAAVRASSIVLLDTTFRNNSGVGRSCGGVDPDGASGCIASTSVSAVRCTFEENFGTDAAIAKVSSGILSFTLCTFRDNETFSSQGGLFVALPSAGSIRAVQCLFVDNRAAFLGNLLYASEAHPTGLELSNNTFARNSPFLAEGPVLSPGSLIRANAFTGGERGLVLPGGEKNFTVYCNNAYGNVLDYAGFDRLLGRNINRMPRYCDTLSDVFTVSSSSPHLNNQCGFIGAFGAGCGPISVESSTWGSIKSRYRE